MVISSDNDFVQKPLPSADMVLFAKDLVDYVMFYHCLNYTLNMDTTTSREFVYNAFNENTKKAVGFIANGLKENNVSTFRKMLNGTTVCVDNYTRLAKSLALRYFDESFDCKLFLFYCVRISGIASLYYNHGISNAPMLAKLHITCVLQKYYMIVGLWRTVHRTAESLNNMQRVNDLIFMYTDSEEIDLLYQTQDEVTVNEVNSSIGRQNVLLKDEENKVQQQEYLHAEKESLKKSDKFFTESNSEMDLSAFKTPDIWEDISAFKTPDIWEDLSAFKTPEALKNISAFKTLETLEDLGRQMSLTEIESLYNEASQPIYSKPTQLMYNKNTVYAATKNIPRPCPSYIQQQIIAIVMSLKQEMDLRINKAIGNSQIMEYEVSDLSLLQKRDAFRTHQMLLKKSIVYVKVDTNRPFGPSGLNVRSKHLNMLGFEGINRFIKDYSVEAIKRIYQK